MATRWRRHAQLLSLLPSVLAVLAGPAGIAHAVPLDGIRAVTVSADGAYVYAAAEFADSLVVFRRTPSTGALTPIQVVHHAGGGPQLDAINSVALSPDGRHLYAAAFVSSALNVFARDPGSGLLSFVEAEIDGVGGVDGLRSAHGAVVSPDGANVYVAGYEADAVAAFARDPVSGALSFVEAQRNGVGGVEGLDYVGSGAILVSPTDNAIAVFARDPASGLLTFVEAQFDNVGGVDGLFGVYEIAFAAGGASLYAASFGDNAVAVFDRDAVTGGLAFRQAIFDGPPLGGAHALVASPDDAHVYVAAFNEPALAWFARDAETGALTFVDAVNSTPASPGDCPPVAPACRQSSRAKLVLKQGRRTTQLSFAWRRGAATAREEFGDPIHGATGYRLCIYDTAGDVTTLVAAVAAPPDAFCPAGPGVCWQESGKGLRYQDASGTADGLASLVLRPGDPGQAGLRATAGPDGLTLLALPLLPPVTALLVNADGLCWSGTFASESIRRNGDGLGPSSFLAVQ